MDRVLESAFNTAMEYGINVEGLDKDELVELFLIYMNTKLSRAKQQTKQKKGGAKALLVKGV